jgi:hypothetical protein
MGKWVAREDRVDAMGLERIKGGRRENSFFLEISGSWDGT